VLTKVRSGRVEMRGPLGVQALALPTSSAPLPLKRTMLAADVRRSTTTPALKRLERGGATRPKNADGGQARNLSLASAPPRSAERMETGKASKGKDIRQG
jgi:hypothetical protein